MKTTRLLLRNDRYVYINPECVMIVKDDDKAGSGSVVILKTGEAISTVFPPEEVATILALT